MTACKAFPPLQSVRKRFSKTQVIAAGGGLGKIAVVTRTATPLPGATVRQASGLSTSYLPGRLLP